MTPISSATLPLDPYNAQPTEQPRNILTETQLSEAVQGLVQPGSPFEAILRDIFQKLAIQEEDAIKLRALAIEAEQLWRKELIQKLGEEGVSAASKNRQNNLTSTFAHIVEPLPLIAAGATALCVSTAGTGLIVLAVAGIAIGSLMVLDAALGDPAKKALASALSKGDTESTQTWMGRIFMASGIASLACSIGLTAGTAGAISLGLKAAISTAAGVSEAAAQGAQAYTERRANVQNALMIELEEELRRSDRKLKDDFASVKQLEKNVKDLFELFEASMKFHVDASSRIFA